MAGPGRAAGQEEGPGRLGRRRPLSTDTGGSSSEPAVEDSLARALQHLLDASHLARPDDLPTLAAQAGALLGATRTALLLVDYDQRELVPFGADSPRVSIEGTLAGRAYADVALQQSGDGDLWVPLLDGTDRLGVVQLSFPARADDGLRRDARALASVLAELVCTRSAYGDVIEKVRRRAPMTLPAEVQWRLLPPLTFVTRDVAISGVLAPSNEVAGDSFDYAVNGDIAHVAIVDAIGHGLEAALLATVAVGALRNARRAELPLNDTVRLMDEVIRSQFSPEKFVTAIVGELDTRSGVWTSVTCGHPPALIVRGGRVVKSLDRDRVAPLGLLPRELPVSRERLEPGDRLFLYTDGVVEARDAAGEFFGIDRLVEFVTREAASGRPAPEALRRLSLLILDHQAGQLQDDATTVIVEWLTAEHERATM